MNQVKDWRILVDPQLFAVGGVLDQAQVGVLVLVQVLLSPLPLDFRVPLELLGHRSVASAPRSPALGASRVTKQNKSSTCFSKGDALTSLLIEGRGASLMYSSIVARNDAGGCRTVVMSALLKLNF